MENNFLNNLRSTGLYDPLAQQYRTNSTRKTTSKDANLDAGTKTTESMVKATNSAPVTYEKATETEEVKGPSKSLWDLSTEIIRGNYGNGRARQEALAKEGYNYHQVQDFVNKRLAGTLVDSDYNRIYHESQVPTVPNANSGTPAMEVSSEEVTTTGSGQNNEFLETLRGIINLIPYAYKKNQNDNSKWPTSVANLGTGPKQ